MIAQRLRTREAAESRGFPEWLEVNNKEGRGVFKSLPAREDLPPSLNEGLVVELPVQALGQLHPLPPRADRSAADNVLYCLDLLAAWRSALEGRGEARRELARADSVLLVSAMDIWEIGNLLDAVVAALAGDLDLARRAARRELVQVPVRRLFYAAYLRERGRFALLAGDTTAARLKITLPGAPPLFTWTSDGPTMSANTGVAPQ